MERLFLEHRIHGARQRVERRGGEHRELELAVPVDELRVGEEVEPVVDQLVERPQQSLALVGAPLQQLRRLALSLVAEMAAQQIRHLPAVPHLLGHHAHQRQQIVVRGGMGEQVALLLHRGELRVALVHDQVQERIADALVGDGHHGGPLALAFVVTELDVGHVLLPELRLELEAAQIALRQTDTVLPVAEVVDPLVEVVQLAYHQPLLFTIDAPAAMRSRTSDVANSSFCWVISRSSIDSSELSSLRYKAALAQRPAPASGRFPAARAGWGAPRIASATALPAATSAGPSWPSPPKSAPALNARPAPVRVMTRTASLPLSSRSASSSSSHMALSKAFSFSGRFSVTLPIPAAISTRTRS